MATAKTMATLQQTPTTKTITSPSSSNIFIALIRFATVMMYHLSLVCDGRGVAAPRFDLAPFVCADALLPIVLLPHSPFVVVLKAEDLGSNSRSYNVCRFC